jgi:thiol-disulfide isomerase/thioredoxin
MAEKNKLFIPGILALLGGLLTGYLFLQQDAPATLELQKIEFEDLSGTKQNLSQWQNKVIVLNFWATWCTPCREEIPSFVKLQTDYAAKNVQFIGIAVDEKEKVAAFIKDTPINYPVLMGGYSAMQLSKRAGNRLSGLPYTIVFDRTGKISTKHLGQLSSQKLEKILQNLL